MTRNSIQKLGGILLVLFGAMTLSACVHTSIIASCENPQADWLADVTLVVTPYEYVGENRTLNDAASNLAFINHLEVIASGLRYDSFGITTLVKRTGTDLRCDPIEVENKLFDRTRNPRALMSKWNDLVLWSGKLYEDGSDTYVQHSMRFVQHSRKNYFAHSKNIRDKSFKFYGAIPERYVLFPARKVSEATLSNWVNKITESAGVYDDPGRGNVQSVARLDPKKPVEFAASKGRQPTLGWLHIGVENGPSGWLKVGYLSDELRSTFPELYFLDGIISALQYFHPQVSISDPKLIVAEVQNAFNRFSQSNSEDKTNSTAMLGKLVQGFVMLVHGEATKNTSLLDDAEKIFEEATTFFPSSSKVRTLSALPSLIRCCNENSKESEIESVERKLALAILVDPTDTIALNNLRTFYDYAELQFEQNPFQRKKILEKRELFRAYQNAIDKDKKRE